MKRWMGFALAALMAVSLAACGGGAKPSAGSSDSKQQEDKAVKEISMGDSIEKEGLELAGVYFEASELFPHEKAGMSHTEADIHIEADIKATKDNKTGFGAGEWVPYLTVNYKMKNLDSGKEFSGVLMPMNAADGPHYGANVKMLGAGKYKFSISVESPEKQNYLLHVDKGTGVEGKFWTKPIEAEWTFPYVPKK